MINPNSGIINDGYVRDTDESVESLEARGIVATKMSVEKHSFGTTSSSSKGEGHPIMYGKPQPAIWFDAFPDGGGYPKRFMEWALAEMCCDNPDNVLHLCSGSMRSGVTVDIRPETNPMIVADARAVPLANESFNFIMIDPPYSETYAENLYGVGKSYPKPGELLKEASRLCKVGGLIGLLHFIVPVTRKPLKIRKVYGITTGNGTAIRAWTLLEKVNEDSARWRNGT